eukprot:12893053-Prorocentrum_lima.AAC.1
MVPTTGPGNLPMPPLPHISTPPRMSTPGASSHVPGQLGFSPAATTPQKVAWGNQWVGSPSFGA